MFGHYHKFHFQLYFIIDNVIYCSAQVELYEFYLYRSHNNYD